MLIQENLDLYKTIPRWGNSVVIVVLLKMSWKTLSVNYRNVSPIQRLLYKRTMHGKSPSITKDPNTVQKYSKLIDLVMKIELTLAILMSRFSNVLRNSTIRFLMFLYLVT